MRHIKYSALILLTSVLPLISFPSGAAAPTDVPSFTVAYLCYGEGPRPEMIREKIEKETEVLTEKRYSITWMGSVCGAGDAVQAVSDIEGALHDPSVSLVAASGFAAVQAVLELIKQGPFQKPVILITPVDPEALGLPYDPSKKTSGFKNLTYVAKEETIEKSVEVFRGLAPFKTLYVLLDPEHFAAAGKTIDKHLKGRDYRIRFIESKGSSQDILARIDREKPEALLMAPSSSNSADFEALIEGLVARKIPTFSTIGYDDVDKGVLAGRTPPFYTRLARRIAIDIDRIVSGDEPSELPVVLELDMKTIVNRQTASRIGISIPFDVLLTADVLKEPEPKGSQLTLSSSVAEALKNNLNFKVQNEVIKVASKDHLLRWTDYLPKLISHLDYDIVDSGRAERLPAVPKSEFGYGLSLDQLIFSDPVIREIIISKKQVKIEKLNYQDTELVITDETVRTYLSYLRAKALRKVEYENLKAVRANLKTAEDKFKAGKGPREDVLRWESEEAQSKSQVLRRESDVAEARVTLNQLLDHPQEEDFSEEDVALETVGVYQKARTVHPYLKDAETFKRVMDFAAGYAREHSPSLKAIETAVEQRKQAKAAARGKFYLPEAKLGGDLRHNVSERTLAVDPVSTQNEWDFGMRVTFPFFDGGKREVDYLKQQNEIDRLKFKHMLKAQEIERDLRRAGYEMLHSLPSVDFSRISFDKSAQNFEIVKAKYREGLVDITALIDAQTNKFGREADAVIAIYDFLDDLSRFDRQLSKYFMLASEEERAQWRQSIDQYLKGKGAV